MTRAPSDMQAYSEALCALRTASALLATFANATAFAADSAALAADDSYGMPVDDGCAGLLRHEYEQRTWTIVLATVTLALCVAILVRKLGAKQAIRVASAPQL